MQSRFASPEFDFAFAPPDVLHNGLPSVLGSAADGLGIIELAGPAAELSQAYIIVDLPAYDVGTRAVNAFTLLNFAPVAVPTRDDAAQWRADNSVTVRERDAVATTYPIADGGLRQNGLKRRRGCRSMSNHHAPAEFRNRLVSTNSLDPARPRRL